MSVEQGEEPSPEDQPSIARTFFDEALEATGGDMISAVLGIVAEEEALFFAYGYEHSLIEQGQAKDSAHKIVALDIKRHISDCCCDESLQSTALGVWEPVLKHIETRREFGWAWSTISAAVSFMERSEVAFVMRNDTLTTDNNPV